MRDNRRHGAPRRKNRERVGSQYNGSLTATSNAVDDTRQITVRRVLAATSDATGTLALAYSTAGVSSATDWNNLAGAYSEYRIVGIHLEYEPLYPNSYPAGVVGGVGAFGVTHTPGAVMPTSLAQVYDTFGGKKWNMAQRFVIEWRMTEVGEWDYQSTASPVDFGGLLSYVSGLAATTTYGQFFLTYVVDFRFRA